MTSTFFVVKNSIFKKKSALIGVLGFQILYTLLIVNEDEDL